MSSVHSYTDKTHCMLVHVQNIGIPSFLHTEAAIFFHLADIFPFPKNGAWNLEWAIQHSFLQFVRETPEDIVLFALAVGEWERKDGRATIVHAPCNRPWHKRSLAWHEN